MSEPSDEALVLWAATGHRATHDADTWYCHRASDDSGYSAYGGWCVLSAGRLDRIYNHPAQGIATTPALYLMLSMIAFFIWAMCKASPLTGKAPHE